MSPGIAIVLEWETERPDGADEAVERNLRTYFAVSKLRKPANLIFHHVFLTADTDGPHVFVYGKPDSSAFWCKYCPTTEWSSGDEATQ